MDGWMDNGMGLADRSVSR